MQPTTAVATATPSKALSRKEHLEKLFKDMDGLKSAIESALPSHLKAERLLRIVRSAVQTNPLLAQCTRISLLGSIVECSQLGLEPFGAAGHVYLVPYKDGKASARAGQDVYNCQVIIGYRGFIELAERTGRIEDIYGEAVYSNDQFEEIQGTERKLVHLPAKGERGKIVKAYAVAKLKGGGTRWKVVDHRDIARAKAASRGSDRGSSPWQSDEQAMWIKTAVRRLSKWLPMSTEYAHAVDMDERAERGARQHFALAGSDMVSQLTAGSPDLAQEKEDEDEALAVEAEANAGSAGGDEVEHAPEVNETTPTAEKIIAMANNIKTEKAPPAAKAEKVATKAPEAPKNAAQAATGALFGGEDK